MVGTNTIGDTKPLALILLLSITTACNQPFFLFAGKALSGIQSSASDWTFASKYKTLQLETNPEKPYSVILFFQLRGKQIYIDPATDRRWHQNLLLNPSVRVKLGDNIYNATAIEITDLQELEGFSKNRVIYRLELNGQSDRQL